MSARELPFLSGDDVRRYLPMTDAIAAMRDAFKEISAGAARIPLRSHIELPDGNAVALFMPGFLPRSNTLGIKIVTLFGENPGKDLPLIHALMVLMDGRTGVPRAIMDGEALTAIRTGAASGLATDLLARKESDVLVLFGAGTQSLTQLEAVASVRDLKQVYLVDPDQARAEKWLIRLQPDYPFPVNIAECEQAVGAADIICTATTSSKPVFADANVRPGTHINAIGAFKPDRREIPAETVARSIIIVDERQACLTEAGDLLMALQEGCISKQHIAAELGEIITGDHPGRTRSDQITLFKSVGNAAQDLAAAAKILQILNR